MRDRKILWTQTSMTRLPKTIFPILMVPKSNLMVTTTVGDTIIESLASGAPGERHPGFPPLLSLNLEVAGQLLRNH
jgi:hypothetical protein